MAVRLPLILSQPAKRDATAGELIENIVAAALLLPKLDANLVGDISCIELGSTDHLCLQGHGRDVILASFLEMASAEAAWHRLGQSGQFIDCHQSAAAIRQLSSSTTERRVFYFQLSHSLKIAKLLDQCQELVAAQAVQLVSIQLGGANPRGAGSLPIVSQPIRPSTNGHTHSHPPTNPAVTSPSAIHLQAANQHWKGRRWRGQRWNDLRWASQHRIIKMMMKTGAVSTNWSMNWTPWTSRCSRQG